MPRYSDKAACFVYLIGLADRAIIPAPLKIGFAAAPQKRLAELQVGCPFKLEVIRTWRFPGAVFANGAEQRFHERNAAARVHGEWFEIDERDAIKQLNELKKEFWKIKRLPAAEGDGRTAYRVGNLIAVGPTLTPNQIKVRRSAYLSKARAT